MLGALPVYAPFAWITGSPVAAHQATLVATFPLAFLTACAAVRVWTASWAAGIVAGALFAFSPMRIAHLGSLQMEGSWWLPLVALSTERALATGATRWSALLFLSLTLESLWSYYLGYAGFLAAAAFAAAILVLDPRARRHVGPVVAAGAASAVAVGVASLPYLRLRDGGVLQASSVEFLRFGSATLGRTGAAPALLAAVATAPWTRSSAATRIEPAVVAALWLVAALGHLVALGPVVELGGVEVPGPYALLAKVVPGLAMIRVPQRLNVVASLALALLAGLGIAGLLARFSARAASAGPLVAATAAVAGVIVAASPVAIPVRPVPTPPTFPPVYAWLATRPPAPLVEIPFRDVDLAPAAREVEALRMYFGTAHWHPLLNGYSGYTPAGYRIVSTLARTLPHERSAELLVATTAVRRIVLHRRELSRTDRRRWRRADRRWLRPVAKHGADVVFEPAGLVGDATVTAFRATGTDRTIAGTPLVPLAATDRVARVDLAGPVPPVFAGIPFDVEVRVENISSVRWPSLAVFGDHAIGLVYRWEDADGRVLSRRSLPQILPDDLQPGATTPALVVVKAPRASGRAFLVVGVAQDDAWFTGESARVPVEILALPAPRSNETIAPVSKTVLRCGDA